MKKNILITLIACIASFSAYALPQPDSVKLKKLMKQVDSIRLQMAKSKSCVNCFADTTKKSGYLYNENGHFVYSARTFGVGHWVLVFLPVILFGCILLYTLAKLSKDKFSLADALSENFVIDKDIPNPQAAIAGEPR